MKDYLRPTTAILAKKDLFELVWTKVAVLVSIFIGCFSTSYNLTWSTSNFWWYWHWKVSVMNVISYEYCESFKNRVFTEHLHWLLLDWRKCIKPYFSRGHYRNFSNCKYPTRRSENLNPWRTYVLTLSNEVVQ